MISQWPSHQMNEVVSIIDEVKTRTHRLLLRSDGLIWVGFDSELLTKAEVPGYVHVAATKQTGDLLSREERDAMRRLFDQADKLEEAS